MGAQAKAKWAEPSDLWPLLSQSGGRQVDRGVRSALISSLDALHAKATSNVDYEDECLKTLLRKIDEGPVRPAIFGVYTDLVESFLCRDAERFGALSDTLLRIDPACEGTRIVTLIDEHLGPGQAERYARLIDDDPDRRYLMKPLVRQFPEASARVSAALSLLDGGAPELAQDIRELLREVVLVTEHEDDGSIQPRGFEGASTFYLWGAIFINIGDATRLDVAQTLAHEAAHLLLFGLMKGQPMTANEPSERYSSPLREDPRPMEGVVHAAYVLARMSYACERFLESGSLLPEERTKAQEDLASHRNRFFDTLPIIERHAQFRSGGDDVFQGAVAYMCSESEANIPVARIA